MGAYAQTPSPTGTSPAAASSQPVSVVPYNGGALVRWNVPANGVFVQEYTVTAVPDEVSRTSTMPPEQAAGQSVHVPAAQHSLYLSGLAADCHTLYVFTVVELDVSGSTHALGTVGNVRPSGYVPQDEPRLVEVEVDGAGSSFDWNGSVTYDPLSETSYCPEQAFSSQAGHTATVFHPPEAQDVLDKWFDLNHGLPGAFDDKGNHTHAYLDDTYAAHGAVILPYSYEGALLSRDSTGHARFTLPHYTTDDSTNGALDYHATLLDQEVHSIHTTWPHTKIVVFGHSYGGLVSEWYWQSFWAATNDHDGVTHVFSLDAPINGVARGEGCGAYPWAWLCTSKSGYSRTLLNVFGVLWDGATMHDQNIVQIDRNDGFVYSAVWSQNDPAYYGFFQNGVNSGRASQAVAPLDSGVNFQSCDVPPQPDWVNQDGHFLVKSCPSTIAFIQRTVPAPQLGSCPAGAAKPCDGVGPFGPAAATSLDIHEVDWSQLTLPAGTCGSPGPVQLHNAPATVTPPGGYRGFPTVAIVLGGAGRPVYGDLAGDGRTQAALDISCDTGGLTGGSGLGDTLLVYGVDSGNHLLLLGVLPSTHVQFGTSGATGSLDNIKVVTGAVTADEHYSQSANDPFCCPTGLLHHTWLWRADGGFGATFTPGG